MSEVQKYEKLFAEKEKQLQSIQACAFSVIEEITSSIKKLDEIALKPNALSEIDHLDLLIISEKEAAKPGWQKRLALYLKLRQELQILNKLPSAAAGRKSGANWWKFWK